MSTIKTKNIQQKVISGTTQPLKIGGILDDGSDAKISIDTSGNVSLNNLSNTLNLTSGQIKFPATQVPSSDANTLDDYEEGTWTPNTSLWTTQPNSKTGRYVKIGKLVTINISMNGGAFSTDQFITGLPFPISADSGIAYIEPYHATTPIVIGVFAAGFPYQISYTPAYNAGSAWWLVQGTYESY